MPFKRGTTFFFNALDVHRGSGIPKASPTGVADPQLTAFLAIELTQGPNLRFPNLHVTQAIKRPHKGPAMFPPVGICPPFPLKWVFAHPFSLGWVFAHPFKEQFGPQDVTSGCDIRIRALSN